MQLMKQMFPRHFIQFVLSSNKPTIKSSFSAHWYDDQCTIPISCAIVCFSNPQTEIWNSDECVRVLLYIYTTYIRVLKLIMQQALYLMSDVQRNILHGVHCLKPGFIGTLCVVVPQAIDDATFR